MALPKRLARSGCSAKNANIGTPGLLINENAVSLGSWLSGYNFMASTALVQTCQISWATMAIVSLKSASVARRLDDAVCWTWPGSFSVKMWLPIACRIRRSTRFSGSLLLLAISLNVVEPVGGTWSASRNSLMAPNETSSAHSIKDQTEDQVKNGQSSGNEWGKTYIPHDLRQDPFRPKSKSLQCVGRVDKRFLGFDEIGRKLNECIMLERSVLPSLG